MNFIRISGYCGIFSIFFYFLILLSIIGNYDLKQYFFIYPLFISLNFLFYLGFYILGKKKSIDYLKTVTLISFLFLTLFFFLLGISIRGGYDVSRLTDSSEVYFQIIISITFFLFAVSQIIFGFLLIKNSEIISGLKKFGIITIIIGGLEILAISLFFLVKDRQRCGLMPFLSGGDTLTCILGLSLYFIILIWILLQLVWYIGGIKIIFNFSKESLNSILDVRQNLNAKIVLQNENNKISFKKNIYYYLAAWGIAIVGFPLSITNESLFHFYFIFSLSIFPISYLILAHKLYKIRNEVKFAKISFILELITGALGLLFVFLMWMNFENSGGFGIFGVYIIFLGIFALGSRIVPGIFEFLMFREVSKSQKE